MTPEQGITIVKTTAHKTIRSLHSRFPCKILSGSPEIPQLYKTGLTETLNVPRKRETGVELYSQIFLPLLQEAMDY